MASTEPVDDDDQIDPLMCAAANAMAAPFCASIEDWSNLNDVTQTCLQAEVSINTMLGFLNLDHLEKICNYPDQLEAVCKSVDADDDMTTCELGYAIEDSEKTERRLLKSENAERRQLARKCSCGCFDEMTMLQTRSGEKYMRDVVAGEEILTCEAGVYTRVFANVDHHDDASVPLLRLETNTSSLTLTPSHFVLSNGQYVRAGDMKVGMLMDGEAITSVSPTFGRRRDIVALRQDITVNGRCGTWVDSSFAGVRYVAPLNSLMNPLAAFYPQFVFSATQKIADVVVPLVDSQVLRQEFQTLVMVTVSLMIAGGNLAALASLSGAVYGKLKL